MPLVTYGPSVGYLLTRVGDLQHKLREEAYVNESQYDLVKGDFDKQVSFSVILQQRMPKASLCKSQESMPGSKHGLKAT